MSSHFPMRCFAFDQFGPLSIRPCHGSSWAPESTPIRLRATYHRTHGIRYFHGCYSLGDDQLWGVNRRRKGGDHSLSALQSIRTARPDGAPLYVIMDNLTANKTPAIRAWAVRNKVELCLTPTSASWANPIEAQFGPLRTFTMGASDHPNHPVLARRLQAYLRWRNAHARHPDVLAAQRRERATLQHCAARFPTHAALDDARAARANQLRPRPGGGWLDLDTEPGDRYTGRATTGTRTGLVVDLVERLIAYLAEHTPPGQLAGTRGAEAVLARVRKVPIAITRAPLVREVMMCSACAPKHTMSQ